MSYGIAAYGADGKISFHSDYSSVVYAGQLTKSVDPTRPTYQGDYHINIDPAKKNTNYEMGWIVQYTLTLDVDFMVPFYKPAFNGQEIAIIDIVNEGTTWVVNLLFSGNEVQYPNLYAFAPLTELPSSAITLNNHGIAVYDANSELVFTDSKHPLRIDDVVSITHPTIIKAGSKGSCGNSSSCHVDFASDRAAAHTGTVTNSTSKLYHIVTSAYGGLAYENSGSGTYSCGFLNLFSRNYAWSYKSWASFRGTVRHPRNSTSHVAGWQGDFAGAAHQQALGDCGLGGFLGALIGAFLVIFTGGAALLVIGGALAGFAIGEMTVGTTPSLKAYDTDETFDTSNPVNLLITDTSYYGITDDGDVDISDRFTYQYDRTSGQETYWFTYKNAGTPQGSTFYESGSGYFPSTGYPFAFDTSSATVNGKTYYKGTLQDTYVDFSFNTSQYYKLGIVEGV